MKNPSNWKKETKNCQTCGVVFKRPVWRKAKLCSQSCKTAWNKGKSGLGGYKWKEESRLKFSKTKKGVKIPCMQGAKNPKWISDRSLLKDDHKDRGGQLHRDWSRSVKNRDGWKCKISNGNCSGRLESHHILGWKDYPELRYQLNNGITLCHYHHPRKRIEEKELSPYFQSLVLKAN